MGPTAVIVHLSDLHLKVGDRGLEERNAYLRERLGTDLEELLGDLGVKADVVVVTGDIAYGGKESEYELASSWFRATFDRITAAPDRVLCVPGNHDVDWDLIGPTAEAHRVDLSSAEDPDPKLDAYLAEEGQGILLPLRAYNNFAVSMGCEISDRLHWEAEFPIGGGYVLAFRGVTTVINSGRNDGPGTLVMHSNQFLAVPAPGRIPILLAHHDPHFWQRSHKHKDEVKNRMSIALYGHTHEPRMAKVDECVEITAGATQPEEGKDWMPGYNVLRLTVAAPVSPDTGTTTMTVEAWRRRWDSSNDRFESGACDIRDVQVPVAPGEAPGAPDPPAEEHGEEVRAALVTPEGVPHPIREIQHALYDLGAGNRIRVLDDLGLPLDEFLDLPPYRLIPDAAAAIIEAGKVEAFRELVGKLTQTRDGDADA